jgi:predicted transcriptional regulator
MTEHQKTSKRHAILQRRLQVAQLAAQGRTQLEIADELGVSQPTICADLNEIHAQWRKSAEAETAERIAREIAVIEEIRRAAWQGWARSQEDDERKRVKRTAAPDQDGVKVEKIKERRTRSGDSRMLRTALKCSEMILRTLGAFKTKPTPPVNTWDTVLKALYASPANAEDDAEPGTRGQGPGARERLAPQRGEARESRVEQTGGMPAAFVCEPSPGCSRTRNPGEIAGDVASRGEEKKLGDAAVDAMALPETKAAETATPPPVSDAEPGDPGSCSSRQAGGLPYGGETPTAAPVPDPEPEAVGADDPEECWLTARRGWHRVATISSGGLSNPWPLGRRP